jgi:hypothetical protein
LAQKADNEYEVDFTEAELQDLMEQPKILYKEIMKVMQALRNQNDRYQRLRSQYLATKAELAKSEVTIDRLMARQRTESPAEARRVLKLLDPPRFSGQLTNGTTFDNWLIQVKNKIRGNEDHYPTHVPRDKTLPIPNRPWQHISMEFKSFPKDKKGYDAILVIVDRFGKRPISMPCYRTATARDLARLFITYVWKYYTPA